MRDGNGAKNMSFKFLKPQVMSEDVYEVLLSYTYIFIAVQHKIVLNVSTRISGFPVA